METTITTPERQETTTPAAGIQPLACEGYRKSLLQDILTLRNLSSEYKELLIAELMKHEQGSEYYQAEEARLRSKRKFWLSNKKAQERDSFDENLLTGYEKAERKRLLEKLSSLTGIESQRIESIWQGYYGKGERYNLRGISLSNVIQGVELMLQKKSTYKEKPLISSGFTQAQMEFFEEIFKDIGWAPDIYTLLDVMFEREDISKDKKESENKTQQQVSQRNTQDPIGWSNYTPGNAYGKAK